MAIVVSCPDCGKKDRLPNSEAGQVAVCAACGTQYRLPGAPVMAQPPAPPVPPPLPLMPAPLLNLPPLALPHAGPPEFDGVPPRKWDWWIAGSGFLAVLIFSAVLIAVLVSERRRTAREVSAKNDLKPAAVGTAGHPTSAPSVKPPEQIASLVSPAPAPPQHSAPIELSPATVPPATAPAQPATRPDAPSPPAVVPALAQPGVRPAIRQIVDTTSALTDEQVGKSIQRGVDFLIRQFDPTAFELSDGLVRSPPGKIKAPRNGYHDGADVLCVYALLQCDQAIEDSRLNIKGPFMTGCLEAMKSFPLDDHFGTYSRGLRATALALNNRREDDRALRSDVNSLLKTHTHGGYTYFDDAKKPDVFPDNSNSQYGLLGVWSGAEAGMEIPPNYWAEVEKYWVNNQLASGQWSYREKGEGGELTMTCAGLASLFVCGDFLDPLRIGAAVGHEPFSPALKKSLDWLEQKDRSAPEARVQWWGYTLYGIERVGLASGFKFFGDHNWYPEIARMIIAQQDKEGSWGSGQDIVDTAYALLFLSRGRHPILMNKLRFKGYWANRPRDAAVLAKYAGTQIERPLNWQVVPIERDWVDWTDSPILSLSSHVQPKLEEADVDKIRSYILAGGMLFINADGDAAPMATFAADLGHRLFPQYSLVDVPEGHPLFTSVYKLSGMPPLKMITNGSRILMLFSPTDISKRWQLREQHSPAGKPAFQLGVNMFIYAAGRRELKNRLETSVLAPIASLPSMTIRIARVKYAGDWDPEPYAWTRYARWFQRQTGYALDVQPVAMKDLDAIRYPFAQITGVASYNASSDEADALKRYVEAGGVLLADSTGGSGGFFDSLTASLFSRAFPGAIPKPVSPTFPMLLPTAPGMTDISHARLRAYVHEKLGANAGILNAFKAGKGHVFYTNFDLTSGLLNTSTWGILGYEPAYAQDFLKNAILWTLDGQKEN